MVFMLDDGVGPEAEGFEPRIRKVILAAAGREGIAVRVNVLLTGEEQIRQLNASFRGIDSVTDVLSFPAFEFTNHLADYLEAGGEAEIVDDLVEIGDIAICVPRAAEQAETLGHSLEREIAFLALHGMLHLLGYDHMTPEEEEEMTAVQRALMAETEGADC